MMSPTAGRGLLTFGETMGLVRAEGIGTLDVVSGFRLGIGGAESNVAVAAARLGAPVTWIGRVGRDAVGALIERRLVAERIDVVAIPDDSFTGLMLRHARTGQLLQVDYHRAGSAGSRLVAADVPEHRVRAARIVHVTGITPALSGSARAAVDNAVDVARAAGVTVSVDVNYRRKLWSPSAARPVLRSLVARADIVFAGVAEAQLVLDSCSEDPLALACELVDLGPLEVIIKNGARGCSAVIDGVVMTQAAIAVPVVDPVGAGDAFVAGYLADRHDGADAATRLRTAVAVGAYAVSVPGDCELLPTRTELTSLTCAEDVVR